MLKKRIDIKVDLQRGIALVLQHLLLRHHEVLAHPGHVDAHFELEHYFTDAECLDTGNRGLVGPQHTTAEPLAQTRTQFDAGRLNNSL